MAWQTQEKLAWKKLTLSSVKDNNPKLFEVLELWAQAEYTAKTMGAATVEGGFGCPEGKVIRISFDQVEGKLTKFSFAYATASASTALSLPAPSPADKGKLKIA